MRHTAIATPSDENMTCQQIQAEILYNQSRASRIAPGAGGPSSPDIHAGAPGTGMGAATMAGVAAVGLLAGIAGPSPTAIYARDELVAIQQRDERLSAIADSHGCGTMGVPQQPPSFGQPGSASSADWSRVVPEEACILSGHKVIAATADECKRQGGTIYSP